MYKDTDLTLIQVVPNIADLIKMDFNSTTFNYILEISDHYLCRFKYTFNS